MPTTVYSGTWTGGVHGTMTTSCPVSLQSGQRPAAGSYRITGASLTASSLRNGNNPTTGQKQVRPQINGASSGPVQSRGWWTYYEAYSFDLTLEDVAARLDAGITSVGVSTTESQLMLENDGCVWTLTIDWTYRYTACTAPASLTLDAAAKRLRILGGAGGVANAMIGYGLEARISTDGGDTWGDWTSLGTVGEDTALSIGAGEKRQYRARTLGEAGSSYFSGYTQCAQTLSGNTGPGAVAVTSPATGAVSYSPTPRVCLFVPAEPDGDSQTVQLRVDGGAWQSFAQAGASGGVVSGRLGTLGAGAHTLAFRLVDAQGAAGAETALSLTVAQPVWRRAIRQGTVVASATVSHRADLLELYDFVNAQRAYFGLGALSPTGSVGRWEDWRAQIVQLRQGLTDCRLAAGETAPAWGDAPALPTAAAVNALRGERV